MKIKKLLSIAIACLMLISLDPSAFAAPAATNVNRIQAATKTEPSFENIMSEYSDIPLDIRTYGDYPFVVEQSSNGEYYARSTNNGVNSSLSVMETNVYLPDGGSIEFYYYLISEENYDFFRFSVNDGAVLSNSGEVGIQFFRWQAPEAGEYNFAWIYAKNADQHYGEDGVRVMDVRVSFGGSLALDLINCEDTDQRLHFRTYGDYPFAPDTEGEVCYDYSTNSGIDNSFSIMESTVDLPAGARLDFDYYLSSEEDYDIFYFYVNDNGVHRDSGEVGMRHFSWVAPSNSRYNFTWSYDKDSSRSYGDDCVRIMNVRISYPSGIMGDVDGDGTITAVDAMMALRGALGLSSLEPDQFARADTDGNGQLTATDAMVILRMALGLLVG